MGVAESEVECLSETEETKMDAINPEIASNECGGFTKLKSRGKEPISFTMEIHKTVLKMIGEPEK